MNVSVACSTENGANLTNTMKSFVTLQSSFDTLLGTADAFASPSVAGLVRTMPDLSTHIDHVNTLYTVERGSF